MTDPAAGRASASRWWPAAAFLLVAVWIAWLRQPALSTPIWNVDEAITAAIGDEILAGGVPYRDATDLRAPLTYYLYAAVFAVAGRNNLQAVHLAHTGLVMATALIVLLLGTRAGGRSAGAWAAWIFAGLACTLFNPLDNFALHTEWPLAFFSALGAWWFLIGHERRRSGLFVAAGVCYGIAALSKQPALLDFAAPLALQACLILRAPPPERRALWRNTVALGIGFAAPIALTAAYFALQGAWSDFLFYTWSYNTRYYVPEVPLSARLPSLRVPLGLLHGYAPSLLLIIGAGLIAAVIRFFRHQDSRVGDRTVPSALALLWLGGALAATTLSGRGFEHYSIQILAPAGLVAGGWLGTATDWAIAGLRRGGRYRLAGAIAGLALAGVAGWQLRHALRYRATVEPHRDPSVAMAAIVREVTTRADRIFVWGFYADFYPLADRLPASRFVHGSFLTGLIPWTNLGRDTSYAIVPGSMDQLLADLEKNRPRLIVDASPALNRRFEGYPPEKFPAFQSYLQEHYIEFEPQRSKPAGWFRFYLRRDTSPLAVDLAAAKGAPPGGALVSFDVDFSGVDRIAIKGNDAAGRLTQLGLETGTGEFRGVSFPATAERLLVVPMPASATVRIVARTADGREWRSEPPARPAGVEIPSGFRLKFAAADLPVDALAAPFKPVAIEQDGQTTWLCHAPSAVRFPLPDLNGGRLHVGYGIGPGAYEKPDASTDGVEFIVQLQPRKGPPVVLHQRRLNPRENPADRGVQPADVNLPPLRSGDHLVLVTRPGPAQSTAYDWSFWTVPRMEAGP